MLYNTPDDKLSVTDKLTEMRNQQASVGGMMEGNELKEPKYGSYKIYKIILIAAVILVLFVVLGIVGRNLATG